MGVVSIIKQYNADPDPPESSLLLSVSSNNRYLEDGSGNPFLLWGTAAWNSVNENLAAEQTISGHLHRSYETRFQTDAAQGCTATLIQLISRYQTRAPNNANDVAPFTTPNDFATFNSAYFAFARTVIDYAATLGIVCIVAPAWMGYDASQGWYDALISNGNTKCYNYGVAVANALSGADNIIWCGAGDRPGSEPHSTTEYQNLIDGIRSVDTRHLWTHHWNFAPSDQYTLTPTDINGCYSWGGITAQVASQYANNDGPCVMLEALYEDNISFGYTSKIGRAQTMESMLAGCKGIFWGNEATWHCGAADTHLPSQSQGKPYLLSTTDTLEFRNCKTVFDGRAWHLLVPDASDVFLTGGNGTAALTPDGTYGVIYSPSGGQTIDRTKMSGTFTVRLFDITTNSFTTLSGGPFPNTGSMTITPTTAIGNNSRGETDWAILLETV